MRTLASRAERSGLWKCDEPRNNRVYRSLPLCWPTWKRLVVVVVVVVVAAAAAAAVVALLYCDLVRSRHRTRSR